MMKSKLITSLILAALAAPGVAMAEDAAPVSANIGFTSDYLFRGISQTGGEAALQGGIDYAHASGFYAGVWGSNVSWVGASSSSLEFDTYLGYSNSLTEDIGYNVGYLRYNYTGVYPSPIPAGFAKADTDEIYAALSWKMLTLKYSHSLGDTFGLDDASGSNYVELNASHEIPNSGITLGAHYGKQKYKGASANSLATLGYAADATATYADYKLSASKDFSGYVVGLAYSSTDAKDGIGQYYNVGLADGSNIDLGEDKFVLSVTHSF